MRKYWQIMLILCSLIIFANLAYAGENKLDQNQLLDSRVQELYKSSESKDAENIWSMLHPRIKGDGWENDKNKFVEGQKKFFNNIAVTHDHKETKVINTKLAVSKAVMNYYENGVLVFSECVGTVWVWDNDNWYLFREFACEFEKEVIDQMYQWKDIQDAGK